MPDYREIYGKVYFDCPELKATLAVDACAKNFTTGHALACLKCPIGRKHAAGASMERCGSWGEDGRMFSLAECIATKCIRCGGAATKPIMGAYCVSCWNRTLEVVRGRNCKGAWPKLTASKMRRVSALVEVTPKVWEKFLRKESARTKAMIFESCGKGSIFVSGVIGEGGEFGRLLDVILPGSQVRDIEFEPVLPKEVVS